MMSEQFIQSHYDEAASYCYGCGTKNDHGLHIESYWDGSEGICEFQPAEYHISIVGYTYGGLLASLIDCHSMATAAAATYQAEGRPIGSLPLLRYVTASLSVTYLRPTPLGVPLTLRARAIEIKPRKVQVACSIFADGEETVRGEVVGVRMPEHWNP
jgi:acyl-coenzyme A thioesterase PaaI-like protein